ncbi:MAG: asparaginase [Acidimicrobiia bacterium]
MGIVIISTGGTIASLPDGETGAVRSVISAPDLLATVPGIDRFGPIRVEEIVRVNGWNVTPDTMAAVARQTIAALEDDDVTGVVVTHGTDTIEETAFFCDLTVASPKPVVVVGAIRSSNQVGADGPRNMLNACLLAGHPRMRGYGTVLTMNDEFHAARWVRKLDSVRVSAFASPDRGPLGLVTPEALRLLAPPNARLILPLPASVEVSVPVLKTYTGMDEGILETVLKTTGARGLIIEGTGLGNVPGVIVPEIRSAIEDGVIVAIATRTDSGGTGPIYGGDGGVATLHGAGVLEAGELTAAKARLLLVLVLSEHTEPVAARKAFESAVAALVSTVTEPIGVQQ